MNPTQILSVLSALAAAMWSVWTWKQEHTQQRQEVRDREAALFVNSLITAANVLQSRLYSVLEEDELSHFRREYPTQEGFSPPTIELLYVFGLFFGWARLNLRYGPFTHDPRVLEVATRIDDTLESRHRFPGDAFRLRLEDRFALGMTVVRHAGEFNPTLPAFEAIPMDEFEQQVLDSRSERHRVFERRAIRLTLEALEKADSPVALEGRERLAALQNHLVDLLHLIITTSGHRVRGGRRCRLPGQAAGAPGARIVHQVPGRVRLEVPRLDRDPGLAPRLTERLRARPEVRSVRVNAAAASVVVTHASGLADFGQSLIDHLNQ